MKHFGIALSSALFLPLLAAGQIVPQAPLLSAFTDTESSSGGHIEVLTLDDAVQEALVKNPALQSARQMADSQHHKVSAAAVPPDPSVSVGWSGSIVPFRTQADDPASFRSISVSQQIPYPGKLKLRGEIAQKELDASQIEVEALRREIVSEVKTAYFDYFYFDKAIQITKKNKDLLEKLSKISEARYRVAKAMQQDVLRSQVEITMLLQKLTTLEQQKATAQARLNTLFDRSPESPLPPASEVESASLVSSIEELYTQAEQNDTSLLRQQQLIEKSKLALKLAQKEHLPDLTVGYMYQQRPDMADMHGFTFSVNVPIFRKNKQQQGVMQAAEELSASEKSKSGLLNDVRFQIKQQYLAAKAAQDLANLYAKAVIPQTSLTLESSMAAYQVGNLDFQSMIGNFTTLLSYETDYYRQIADYRTALAQLEKLTGTDPLEQSGTASGVQNGVAK